MFIYYIDKNQGYLKQFEVKEIFFYKVGCFIIFWESILCLKVFIVILFILKNFNRFLL